MKFFHLFTMPQNFFEKIPTRASAKTYELGIDGGRYRWIECLRCRRRSYNLNDIEQRYCGFCLCHAFHER